MLLSILPKCMSLVKRVNIVMICVCAFANASASVCVWGAYYQNHDSYAYTNLRFMAAYNKKYIVVHDLKVV